MGDVQVLMEMGFPKDRAVYALKVTNQKGVEPAMEWLLAHVDESIPQNVAAADIEENEPGPSTSTNSQKVDVAKSLKCDDCGKLCKDQGEVEFHAAKTGHSNFSESTEEKKPLTEEEKKQQLALIEEKLKQKRLEREEREKQDALERERNRIKSGKDMSEARRRNEELEMKKIIEQRKREKADEKAARERVKAQIEADKARRKAGQTLSSPETPVASSSVSSTTTPTEATAIKSPPKDYKETRIQIRLQDGSTLTETFNVQEQLSAVRVFIQMKTGSETPFGLMTSFPRKVFSCDDFEKPLSALGLVPSAVLIMTKVNV
ncbi:UBX domain-containing protein 1 [Stomoxys calcitrans]|uniref:UBX domain-containing protein n=1 Tax=Stomoxys calcitrans TaxID=35570 RepID=A0A1I8Q0G9_STOCA|nr:UBX domain-containing protein 1 [Stomoxys calcitrans]